MAVGVQPQREGSRAVGMRTLRIVFSPYLPTRHCFFVIDRAGVRPPIAAEAGAFGSAASPAMAASPVRSPQVAPARTDTAVAAAAVAAGAAGGSLSPPGAPARPPCSGAGWDGCRSVCQHHEQHYKQQQQQHPSTSAVVEAPLPHLAVGAAATPSPEMLSLPPRAVGSANKGVAAAATGAVASEQKSSTSQQARLLHDEAEHFEDCALVDDEPGSFATGIFAQ